MRVQEWRGGDFPEIGFELRQRDVLLWIGSGVRETSVVGAEEDR